MKKLLTYAIPFLLVIPAFGQLDRGIWLVGGSGSFIASKQTYTSPSYSSSSDRVEVSIAPNIGFFVTDKLALGLRTSYSKFKDNVDVSGANSNENRLEFGPFVRYYFLKNDQPFNLLADLGYKYGRYWFTPRQGNINTFSAGMGTVVFFNSSVGLELLMGYYNRKERILEYGDIITKQSGFQAQIGFQFHLEK